VREGHFDPLGVSGRRGEREGGGEERERGAIGATKKERKRGLTLSSAHRWF